MANKIQFKRGDRAKLPLLNQGEPGFCTDTNEFYIGNTNANIKILDENVIVNNLITGEVNKVLSAEQGKILDTKIKEVNTRIDNMQGKALYLSEYPNHSDYSALINEFAKEVKDIVIVCEPNKEYRFNSPLLLHGKTRIFGNDCTWRYMGTSEKFITFVEAPWNIEGSVIQDIHFWCNEKSVGSYQKKYCFFIEGNHVLIKFHNLKIYNFGYVWFMKATYNDAQQKLIFTYGHSITECNAWGFITVITSMTNAEQVLVSHCWFDDGLRTGNSQNPCILVSDATSFWVRDSTIQNCDIGILFKGVRSGIIEGNHFENMIDSSIFFNPDSVYDNRNTIVSGNYLVGGKGCIRFYKGGQNATNHTTIFGNIFAFLGQSARACIESATQDALNNTQVFNNSKLDDSRLLYSSEVVTLKTFQ